MQRTPVSVDRPPCFSTYKDDDDCLACNHKLGCSRLHQMSKEAKTVEEWVNELENKTDSGMNVPRLLDFFKEEFRKVGGRAKYITLSSRWRSALENVIIACEAAGIDPRLYVRAQVATMGKWAVKNKRPFYANMLQGDKAQGRFEEWLDRNARMHADHHHLSDDKEDTKIAAETHFVEAFFSGCSAKEAGKLTRKVYPNWRVRTGRNQPVIRVKALCVYLVSLNPVLPRRITLATPEWKWGTVRKEIASLLS